MTDRTITLRVPSKYATSTTTTTTTTTTSTITPLPSSVLYRTWSVTHSTLSMWRSAQNVRITYRPLDDGDDGDGDVRGNRDCVAYESNKPGATPKVKTVAGTNSAAETNSPAEDGSSSSSSSGCSWNWRGNGWLFFVTSHWEILGWGEVRGGGGGDDNDDNNKVVERWAVTWFAPTWFTSEGLDIYCDRPEGLRPETLAVIQEAIRTAEWPQPLADLAKQLQPVDIKLPWHQ